MVGETRRDNLQNWKVHTLLFLHFFRRFFRSIRGNQCHCQSEFPLQCNQNALIRLRMEQSGRRNPMKGINDPTSFWSKKRKKMFPRASSCSVCSFLLSKPFFQRWITFESKLDSPGSMASWSRTANVRLVFRLDLIRNASWVFDDLSEIKPRSRMNSNQDLNQLTRQGSYGTTLWMYVQDAVRGRRMDGSLSLWSLSYWWACCSHGSKVFGV